MITDAVDAAIAAAELARAKEMATNPNLGGKVTYEIRFVDRNTEIEKVLLSRLRRGNNGPQLTDKRALATAYMSALIGSLQGAGFNLYAQYPHPKSVHDFVGLVARKDFVPPGLFNDIRRQLKTYGFYFRPGNCWMFWPVSYRIAAEIIEDEERADRSRRFHKQWPYGAH